MRGKSLLACPMPLMRWMAVVTLTILR